MLFGIALSACNVFAQTDAGSYPDFDRLMNKAVALGNQRLIMPIDLFDIANEMSELKNQDLVVRRLISEGIGHESAQVRRIAIHACLRSKRYTVPGLKEAIAERLRDKNAWVRYDAAWLVKDAKYFSSAIVASLESMTKDISYEQAKSRQSKNPGDFDASSALQAYETLLAIQP